MPGNSDDTFDFTGVPGGPETTIGDLTVYAIQELNFDQGSHASGEPVPRSGLPNIGDDQQGDIFQTVDLLEGLLGL